VRLADTPAVEHHPVAGLEPGVRAVADHPGQVDAGHHRELADHRRAAGDGQAVLEVQCGVLHVDGDVTVGQLRFVEVTDLHRLP